MDTDNNNKHMLNGWRLEKTISISNVLATISAVVAVFVLGSELLTRVTVLEKTVAEFAVHQTQTDARQDTERVEMRRQVREDVKAINEKLDRLIEYQARRQ